MVWVGTLVPLTCVIHCHFVSEACVLYRKPTKFTFGASSCIPCSVRTAPPFAGVQPIQTRVLEVTGTLAVKIRARRDPRLNKFLLLPGKGIRPPQLPAVDEVRMLIPRGSVAVGWSAVSVPLLCSTPV